MKLSKMSMLAVAFALTAGCQNMQKKDEGQQSGAGAPSGASGGPASAGQQGSVSAMTVASDSEILGVVMAVDQNEVLASAQALEKDISPEVKRYARMVHQSHAQNQGKLAQIGKKIGAQAVETQAVDTLKTRGSRTVEQIAPLEGETFERAYIDAMVSSHADTLALIDNQLLSAAQSPELRQSLMNTRRHVAAHLQEARQLQK